MKIDYLTLPGLAAPVGFSHVTVSGPGRLVHISGQVSKDAAGHLIGAGDLALQTEQVYANLFAALEAAGADPAAVVKVVTYVVDLTAEKAALVRTVRNRLLGSGPYPASTLVGVSSLVAPELLIEIDAMAAID
ncbi:TPA: RidA family protein [Burkholderia stabilis]|uniref:2-aminomuconate deaminase,putative endoribonuclease L-PSP,Endoribonuclease L-PSP n=1 Tax=Burkholderia stabilis TaxID=95485 RepID=A0AAJ5T5I0_9BURK|nr:RidA family protein [Burkholderia stabilis]VBB13439.1 2-aminomuconate deaminase,putative endoribonuclease L-PSP,Endoribonuclease L-PSP [Burkholderia stabilis]HDR9582496.1 RidA family protein [Burkholderia stabilis]HDR9589473.1 RidA family protein [Burkholderia stabilis]HDR9648029.1 RidA family protein [Burkholderia stabilis]HDR9653740.1 RidA family protein [Burkholderia stabilis]